MLDPEKVRDMVLRLLQKKHISKKELAQLLNIRLSVIEKICNQPDYEYGGDPKMYLRLIKLYCSTDWLARS